MTTAERRASSEVLSTIRRHLIGDVFPFVVDLEASKGSWIQDAETGERYLDFYTFFASLPLGFNHPIFQEPRHRERLLASTLHKPANSDTATPEYASFAKTFAEKAMHPAFSHLFFIEGGALAVENALKTAFDWKVRRNLAAGRGELGSRILHFREAFHGRSGYTLSLTNTLPIKTAYFPKFDWPRVSNPKLSFPATDAEIQRVAAAEDQSLQEIEAAFRRHPHDIAAIIIEPIQGEGGDNHFRGEFLRALRRIADEHEALLIFDEVQCGFGISGKMWAFEHFDVIPDIVAFGKKSQVCGIMAGSRIDEEPENVFRVPSRLNSTWGGGLADMARCEIILEAYQRERIVDSVARNGAHLLASLESLARRQPGKLSNPRGRGLMCAVDCVDAEARNALIRSARANHLLILACGQRSVRFRPALTISSVEIDEGMRRLEASLR